MAGWRMSAPPPPAPRLAGGADRGLRGVVRGCPLLTADLGWFAAPARPGWASGSVWSRTPPALRSSATRDRSAGRARQGRYKLGHEHILIRHICGMRSRWQHTTRPAQRSDGSDRGCPLDTGVVRLMWHANGTTGEERLGAGGELEALRPPARSPLFAGASNRHHLPTGGAPGAALPPGSLRGTRPGPGRHSRFYAGGQEGGRLPYPPCKQGNGGWPGRLGTHPCQLHAGNRCADCCFARWRWTVRAEVMWSTGHWYAFTCRGVTKHKPAPFTRRWSPASAAGSNADVSVGCRRPGRG
jgi:hypothetical protein